MDPMTVQLLFSSIAPLFNGIMAARNVHLQIQSNEALEEKRQVLQREIADFQAEVQRDIAKANLAFQAMRLQKEQALQRELTELNSQRQLEVAKMQRDTALKMPEVHTLFANWPLRIVPSQILNAFTNKQPRPLRVLLSPPTVEFDKFIHPNPQVQQSSAGNFPKLEKQLAESLRELLNQHYPQTSTLRPVELFDGAWDSSRYSGGASLRALYSLLQSEPIVILDSEADGDFLNFRVAYWRLAQETYAYQPILSRFPYREVLYAAAKARALAWKEVRDKLLADGGNLKEINEQYGGDNVANLAILEDDEKKRQKGIVIKRHYRVNEDDWRAFCQVLSAYHTMTLGVIADGHFLLHYDTPPQFIQLLPTWLSSQAMVLPTDIVQWVVDRYEEMFQALMGERAYRVPWLRLELAESLAQAQFLELAQRQVKLAVQQYFAGRLASQDFKVYRDGRVERVQQYFAGRLASQETVSLEELLTACLQILMPQDIEFLTRLQVGLRALRLEGWVARIQLQHEESVRRLAAEKARIEVEKRAEEERKRQEEEEQKRLVAEMMQIEEERKRQEEAKKGMPFTFETVTVSDSGRIIGREHKTAYEKSIDLGNGVKLVLVYIPAGEFMMGAQDGEAGASNDEYPRHKVVIANPFYMGKYPVTQVQWRAIMGNNPSHFKWDNRPVETVSWEEAMAFCQELSQRMGDTYRLPSEAQWEYACRAGTTTPFHCGRTITTDLANYNSNKTYANEPKGKYRKETTPVGTFPPNAFGLYDMHGNVWEWCQDVWHKNYAGAPTDGSAWVIGGKQDKHLLRGGAWCYYSHDCRSAFRPWYFVRLDNFGFRLSCSR